MNRGSEQGSPFLKEHEPKFQMRGGPKELSTSAIQPTFIGSQLHRSVNGFNMETAEKALVLFHVH